MKDMASDVNSFVLQTHTKGASLDHDVTIVNLFIFTLSPAVVIGEWDLGMNRAYSDALGFNIPVPIFLYIVE